MLTPTTARRRSPQTRSGGRPRRFSAPGQHRRRDRRTLSEQMQQVDSMTPAQVGEAVFESYRFVNLFWTVRKPRPAHAQAERE